MFYTSTKPVRPQNQLNKSLKWLGCKVYPQMVLPSLTFTLSSSVGKLLNLCIQTFKLACLHIWHLKTQQLSVRPICTEADGNTRLTTVIQGIHQHQCLSPAGDRPAAAGHQVICYKSLSIPTSWASNPVPRKWTWHIPRLGRVLHIHMRFNKIDTKYINAKKPIGSYKYQYIHICNAII